jgi:molecular chaperone DnaK
LCVQTVGGFCDVIIERNTPIPCERTRLFATAADQQTMVRVAVAQGESERFAENTPLGLLELTGIRPAPRGEVHIEVAFEIDTDGILDVRASDVATGQATHAKIRLGAAVPEAQDMQRMRDRVQRAGGR